MTEDYAELHCLSNFSFLRGASHPEELVEEADRLGYQALALTDECSLAGVVRAHARARSLELTLLVGSTFRLQDLPGTLVLIAPDRQGYAALSQLITRGRRRSDKGHYQLWSEDLALCQKQCLALWRPGFSQSDAEHGQQLMAMFPGLRLMAERPLAQNDRQRLRWLKQLSARLGCAVVATGHVLMHRRGRKPLQDLVTAIRLGRPLTEAADHLQGNAEAYLRPRERLARLFPPAWIRETLNLVQECRFGLDELRYEYPGELVPEGHTPTTWLRELVEQGRHWRFPDGVPDTIDSQLSHELELIESLAYEPFFLTIHDIVRFARERGILCQGRGSAANSVVCYCLGITEVDPRQINLLLERFISKERGEPPDIDVDFEHERREEVIQYIYRKYGRERAALAATVICYRPRSALRDAGKALGLDPVHIEQLVQGIDWRDGEDDWEQQLRRKGLLDDQGPARHLLPLARELIGFPRHLSQHVGGFVIASERVADLVPVENAAMAGRTVIQWDKDDLEALGLLKVDVLSLGMLTVIRKALAMVGERGGPASLADVPPECPAVYRMLQRGHSMGVFQVESRAQMSMLPRLKPDKYYDLVVEVAIVRPGPIQGNMVHPYLQRRNAPDDVPYADDRIREVLKPTLGVPIFQEQVIRLAMVAAGFSAGEADQLRRAMAAWKRHGDLSRFREKLIDGMNSNGYSTEFAENLYLQMKGFGGYGFPESHAASFALLVYVSAWLKCHHPAAFLCALLNSQPMGFYSPSQLVQNARREGVEVRPVDINQSHEAHRLEDDGDTPAVRLGLRLIDSLGRDAALHVVECRPCGGYTSLQDLRRRTGLASPDLEALAASGALQPLSDNRHQARWDLLEPDHPLPLAGDGGQPPRDSRSRMPAPDEAQRTLEDCTSLGLTLERHPLAQLRDRGRLRHCLRAVDLENAESSRPVAVSGLVTGRQRPGSAAGVTFVTLEDETGNINVIVWRDTARCQRRPLLNARLLQVRGTLERQEGVIHVIAGRLDDLSHLIDRLNVRSRDFQ
ncbi:MULTISPECIES: error-prone DNA polymerase [Halomonadaceae]|uniref:Error-prone DNA polymerase n=1 Tax=Vreelandella halophila TaxID=86177 RepID=A0A9X5B4X2_9GAMM|nr:MULTISPECIES: error-prone DNA polymerase [Halomonas]MYL26996.1 DNA polymerase III subunit alpha [Halomonas utahensis]MYL74257.1 DNA polymerase III subunit alpha [Halomonas sp. 22501_18_FS]